MYRYIKRIYDFFGAILLLIITAPVILISSIIILASMGSPVLFKQKRIGYKNKEFYVYKFRSMNNKKDTDGNLLPDMERMTWFGNFIRKASIDELPQLFNVLNGTMSFIGPRPLLTQYLPLYSAEQRRRHDVTPGISGLAQVKGRNTISWTEKFKFDVYYVDHFSLWLDVKIFFLTIYVILFSRGVNASSQNTMTFFDGKN